MNDKLIAALGIFAALIVAVLMGFSYIDQNWGPSGVLVAAVAMGLVVFMSLVLFGGVAFSFGIARVMAYMVGTGLAQMGRTGSADAAYYRYQSQMERNRMITDKQAAAQPIFGQQPRQWAGEAADEDGDWVDAESDGWVMS